LRTGGRQPPPRRTRPPRHRSVSAASEALRLAIAEPETIIPLLHPVLFDHHTDRAAFMALQRAEGDLHRAAAEADPVTADYLMRLTVEESDATIVDVRRLLLRDVAQRVLHDLEREARTSDDFAGYAAVIGWLKTEIEAVGPDAVVDPVREHELLEWITQRERVA